MPLTVAQQKTLCQSPLFSGCNMVHYMPLLQSLEPFILPKGQSLTDVPFGRQALCFLLSGEVEYSTNTGVVFIVQKAPHVLGLGIPFPDDKTPYLPNLRARTSIAVLTFFPHHKLLPLLRTDSTLAMNLLKLQSESIYHLTNIACRFSASSPSVRLAMLLLQHAVCDELDVSFGISNLARVLDVSRATLYRALSELENKGLIQRTKKSIVLSDRGRLAEYIKHYQSEPT